MSWIDWFIVIIPLLIVFFIGYKSNRYVNSVSGFLAAERCAGRYVICVADGVSGLGLITVVATCEQKYVSGLGLDFWGNLAIVIMLFLALSGFVSYRYRETRALTMAEFLEMRYSRGVRIISGILAFLSGVFNYALFPAVAGRFIIYYCQLPDYFQFLGINVSMFGFIMALALLVSLIIVMIGGQLTTMVTDCVQGIFGYFVYAAIVGVIFYLFTITEMREATLTRAVGESFFNPFDLGNLTQFNILYIFIGLFSMIYTKNAWLGQQGYFCAAISAHEQKMAGVLSQWRVGFMGFMMVVIVLGVFTFMNHPTFANSSQAVMTEISSRINFDNPATTSAIRSQMLVPIALRHLLPAGMVGAFCAMMLFLMISTDTTYMHSWGSILIQDVILPIRNKPISEKSQMLLLRLSILGIAIFAWTFSFYFGQMNFILMFFAMTGIIYLGGAGVTVIGGLYWRKGTSLGAYCALISSAIFGVSSFILEQNWANNFYPYLAKNHDNALNEFRLTLERIGNSLSFVQWDTKPEVFAIKFPISSQEIYFLAMLFSIIIYIVVSKISCREKFNLEKMLHRGTYATHGTLEEQAIKENQILVSHELLKKKNIFQKYLDILLGITNDYTHKDRALAWSVFIWTMFQFGVFIYQLISNVVFGYWSDEVWFKWWIYYTLPLMILYGVVTTIWFVIGGIVDLKKMFKILKNNIAKHNVMDNGEPHDKG